jgi:hypothetical protein
MLKKYEKLTTAKWEWFYNDSCQEPHKAVTSHTEASADETQETGCQAIGGLTTLIQRIQHNLGIY